MKNAQVRAILQLSPLETKVYDLIFSSGSSTVIEIAKILFGKSKRKPKSISNSVTSAIRQINRKFEKHGLDYRIVGKANGRGGKIVYFGDLDMMKNPRG